MCVSDYPNVEFNCRVSYIQKKGGQSAFLKPPFWLLRVFNRIKSLLVVVVVVSALNTHERTNERDKRFVVACNVGSPTCTWVPATKTWCFTPEPRINPLSFDCFYEVSVALWVCVVLYTKCRFYIYIYLFIDNEEANRIMFWIFWCCVAWCGAGCVARSPTTMVATNT